MYSSNFAGREQLVARLDHAVQQPDVEDVTRRVQTALEQLVTEREIRLPSELVRPSEAGYARRLVYQSAEHDYVVIAMTWGPEQGTPLHDHAGVWCVEAVLEGEIDVTQYELLEQQGRRWRFRPQETVRAGLGDAGRLIPPFEYHTIANALDDRSSITLHVYGRELEQCTIFEGPREGWYLEQTRALGYAN